MSRKSGSISDGFRVLVFVSVTLAQVSALDAKVAAAVTHPILLLPDKILGEATSTGGGPVLLAVAANDIMGQSLPVTLSKASGSDFPGPVRSRPQARAWSDASYRRSSLDGAPARARPLAQFREEAAENFLHCLLYLPNFYRTLQACIDIEFCWVVNNINRYNKSLSYFHCI